MMTKRWMTAWMCAAAVLATGCDLFGGRLAGEWEVEVVDADRCGMEMTLEQSGGDVEGDGEIDCRVFFEDGYYYDMVSDDADIEGDLDGDEFELTVTFFDDFFGEELESTLEGEVDGDELTGDIYIEGEWFGEIEGER